MVSSLATARMQKIAALVLCATAVVFLVRRFARQPMRAGVTGLRVVSAVPPLDPSCPESGDPDTLIHITLWVDSTEIVSQSIPVGMGLAFVDDVVRDLSPPYVLTIERLGGCGLDLEWDDAHYGDKTLNLEFMQVRGEDFEEWEDVDTTHAGMKRLTAPNSRMVLIFKA